MVKIRCAFTPPGPETARLVLSTCHRNFEQKAKMLSVYFAIPRDDTQHGNNAEFLEVVQQSLDASVNSLPSTEQKKQWVARGQGAIKADVLVAWHTFSAN